MEVQGAAPQVGSCPYAYDHDKSCLSTLPLREDQENVDYFTLLKALLVSI